MFKLSKLLTQTRLLVFAVFLLASFCAAQQPTAKAQPRPPRPAAAAGHVTKATVRASVPGRQPCPLTVTFAGTITVSGLAEVKYTWVSFDGGSWPEQSIKFDKAGTQNVSESRQVSKTEGGWMELKILEPNKLLSPKGTFRVTCSPPGSKK